MGYIINDAKKNGVIKTSTAEGNREETTSDIYVGEYNNGKKNAEQCPGGNGPVRLSGGDNPVGEEPAVGREGYVVPNYDNQKGQPCGGNLIHPTNVPIQQLPCDINPKVEQNGEVVNCNYEGSPNGVFYLHGSNKQGQIGPSENANMLTNTIEQQQSSLSFQSTLINPNGCAVSTQHGGGSKSIPTTNVQTSVCSASCGGVASHLGGKSPRGKHPRSSNQKPPSSADSDDGDESNRMIRKKIKKKVDENDHLFYAINEFMKKGLKNECIPLFERLQQNLFFLVMLANIPNDNFDELESSSSDY
ncbi:Uncharacterized protein PCOAH_00042880 [Plasmodium coatneyi]|uniref:SS18 N-terminal domain-containing protein n=1 Tax=Plasmodium coatneyi TaxID=208452 RepID=A0A1B1E583_9APIC|nr:Uncharacterized protein PCOAH_00042880 [Plasmodium coatneyi]ANQ10183.1 Uncharacterized protein PCOAH_00042880 [Plasmodium coatneyi]